MFAAQEVEGGSDDAGSINSTGLYQAPAASPLRLPVAITAELGDQSASASVDVLRREVLVSGLGMVQSVAYLEGLSRIYVAELGVAAAGTNLQGSGSVILDVTSGTRVEVSEFPGEEVSKILGHREADGRESLLVAGRAQGNIYRLRVQEPFEVQLVATGLNEPRALALDATTGDLLVAEADRLSRIPAARLTADDDLQESPEGPLPGATSLLADVAPRGLAVDPCSGDLFFSDGDTGSLRRLDRNTGEVTPVVELADPTQLLGILRSGVSCPDGFHLLVVEPALNRVTRVAPEAELASPYAQAPGVQDVAFLPDGAASGNEGVLVTGQAGTGGLVEQLILPGLYQIEAFNPPGVAPCLTAAVIPDANLEAAVRQALQIGSGQNVTCELATVLRNLDASSQGITSLAGFEAFINLEFLSLPFSQITDLTPLAGLFRLQTLDLDRNQISDLTPLSGLVQLEHLNLGENQISDISPLLENPGLGAGDQVILMNNLLDGGDCADINTLVARGVNVGGVGGLCP